MSRIGAREGKHHLKRGGCLFAEAVRVAEVQGAEVGEERLVHLASQQAGESSSYIFRAAGGSARVMGRVVADKPARAQCASPEVARTFPRSFCQRRSPSPPPPPRPLLQLAELTIQGQMRASRAGEVLRGWCTHQLVVYAEAYRPSGCRTAA